MGCGMVDGVGAEDIRARTTEYGNVVLGDGCTSIAEALIWCLFAGVSDDLARCDFECMAAWWCLHCCCPCLVLRHSGEFTTRVWFSGRSERNYLSPY